jgi:hypothetical protein
VAVTRNTGDAESSCRGPAERLTVVLLSQPAAETMRRGGLR